MTLPYPPPWMDKATLCEHICAGDRTIDTWVATGVLPAPRKRGGKLMWRWSEVDAKLTLGKSGEGPDPEVEAVRNGTREELNAH